MSRNNSYEVSMRYMDKAVGMVSIAGLLALVGCATSTPVARLDGQPLTKNEDAIKIALHPSKTFPGRPFDTHWYVDIESIDGQVVPDKTVFIQLSPGEHTLTYACRVRMSPTDLGGATSKRSTKVTLGAGKTYYAYARGTFNTTKTSGGYVESNGTCSISDFSTENPFTKI